MAAPLAFGARKKEPPIGAESCVPFTEANRHLGKQMCIRGTVMTIRDAEDATYLNLCADYRKCPLSVVIFDDDANRVGDVRALAGKEITVRGKVEEYDGRLEMVLSERSQLYGIELPPIPREYDVTSKGHASAGRFSRPHHVSSASTKSKRTAPDPTATLTPDDVEDH